MRCEPISARLRRLRFGLFRHVGRRRRDVLAEKVTQNPLSTKDRGCLVGVSENRKQTRVGQEPATLRGDRRPNGGLRSDRRKPVVSGQPIVHEAEARREKLARRNRARGEFAKQEQRLLTHGAAQVLVERLEDDGIGRDVLEVALVEPLGSEVLDERCRLRIGHEATHLSAKVVLIGELVGSGSAKELGVGHRAPEEIGEARSHLVAVQDARSGRRWIAIVFEAIEKARREEHCLQNPPERLVGGVTGCYARGIQLDEPRSLRVGEGLAPRSGDERVEHRRHTRLFLRC